jgi:hypothetical protein
LRAGTPLVRSLGISSSMSPTWVADDEVQTRLTIN